MDLLLTRPDFAVLLNQMRDGLYLVDHRRRITFWNDAAERITGFRREEVLGRPCASNILMHVDGLGRCLCTSGCPLSASMEDVKPREAELFLHHRQGHRVPVSVRVAPLTDLAGRCQGAAELFSGRQDGEAVLEARIAELESLARLDGLTRVANRRGLTAELDARLSTLREGGLPVGVAFLDVDRFKLLNDRHGHAAGDAALRTIAGTLQASARPFDTVGRWGGEEFLVILPNATPDVLRATADRLLMLVRTSRIHLEGLSPLGVTVSIGATLARPGDSVESLVARADALMYRSKAIGRNRATNG